MYTICNIGGTNYKYTGLDGIIEGVSNDPTS